MSATDQSAEPAQTEPAIAEAAIVDRDREVLADLDAAGRNFAALGHSEWVRPMDCGGRSNTDHSYRLARLVRAGLAEAEQRSSNPTGRGSKRYRITAAGRAALSPVRS